MFRHYLALITISQIILVTGQNLPANETSSNVFSISSTQEDTVRSAEIDSHRADFQYGPGVILPGEGPQFPQGPLAERMVAYDQSLLFAEQLPWTNQCQADGAAAGANVAASGGFKTIEDYLKIYNNFKIVLPDGPYPGILSNGSDDLTFSMERLSTAPLGVRRLKPTDAVSFTIDETIAKQLTMLTQAELLEQSRLFYVDYREQAGYPVTAGRSSAACEAFFYIHPESAQFLPLAIRLNNGNDLIYTPADLPADWLFAKMAFNMNDLNFQQWSHLSTCHLMVNDVFMAAVRTLSFDHPVYGLFDRLAHQTFAFPIFGVTNLLNLGGPIDTYFAINGTEASDYTVKLHKASAGHWSATEFITDLQNRGLIDSPGPALSAYPFYEDGSVINDAIGAFTDTFVDSFYATDEDVVNDSEFQAFVSENKPSGTIDFPETIQTKQDISKLLQHFSFLVSVLHGAINTNNPVHSTAALPYHPTAFYQPLPTTKGLTDLVPFLPNLTQSIGQVVLLSAFNRPFIHDGNAQGSNRTLVEMFDLESFLERSNDQTRAANEEFKSKMIDFSKVVRARVFDGEGLSQGMPFIWTALDPLAVPFYATI